MGILDGLFGNYSKRELKKIDPIKQKVLDLDSCDRKRGRMESSGQEALPRADNRCHCSSSGQNCRDENR